MKLYLRLTIVSVVLVTLQNSVFAQESEFVRATIGDNQQVASPQLEKFTVGANESFGGTSYDHNGHFDPSYETRGTLLQWSYGTSFSGGPNLDEPLVTDRPDFTEAGSTVGRGVAQLEIGYTYTFDDDGTGSTKSHSYPEPLLRLGVLAEWLEFRVGWNYADEETAGVTTSGSEDLYLGFKIGLTPQEGCLPEMALIPQMTVPTGSGGFSSDEVLPGLNWIYGWELSDNISTAGSTQFNRAIDGGTSGSYTEWAQSWTIAYSLTDKVGAYTEYYGLYPSGADTIQTEHYFNGGFTYLVSDNVQWDIRAGTGLNEASDDFIVGTGLSIRSARRRR